MEKNLPPIFKVSSDKIPNNNKKYSYSKQNERKKQPKPIIEENEKNTIEEKIDRIFQTRGYSFNIPVTITFAGKKIDTYLATRTNNSIITLDNETIPISTITDFQIKNPIDF